MITFHASDDGRTDCLDFHTPEGDKFYLNRQEARRLAEAILAAPDITPGPSVRYRLCPVCSGTAPVEEDGVTMAEHDLARPYPSLTSCPGVGFLASGVAS